MVLARYERTVQDALGNRIDNFWTEVRVEDDPLLPVADGLCSDRAGTTPLDNPFFTASGRLAFHAPGSAYRVRVWTADGRYDETFTYQPVGTAQEVDFPNMFTFDENGAVTSLARFLGSVSQDATGTDRLDIGVESGTPRMVFEDAGSDIWLIDNFAGVFRWFTPGVVQMQLTLGSKLTLNQPTAEINLGHATDTTITRLTAGEVAIESRRVATNTAPATKSADFSVAANENNLINNKTSTCVVTLPSAASYTARELWFCNEQAQLLNSASSNVIPRAGGSAGTAILPATLGAWARLVSNGTNWKIMASGV